VDGAQCGEFFGDVHGKLTPLFPVPMDET